MIAGLLAGDTESSSRFELVDARISPLPPHGVEWWIGAGVPRALRRAAELGDVWYTDTRVTPESLAEPMARYADDEVAAETIACCGRMRQLLA